MLSENLLTLLNDQINHEHYSSYLYLSMAAYFEAESLNGFAAWLRHHSDEEMVHAMKIYDFINHRRGRVMLDALPAPRNTWDSPIAAFENALEHEKRVTASIDALMDLTREEKDHATESFLMWFVDEQVEEEEQAQWLFDQLEMAGESKSALLLLDRELAARKE